MKATILPTEKQHGPAENKATLCAVLLALLGWAGLVSAAEAQPSAPPPVGEWGRTEALVFEGLQTFTREQVIAGLALDLDFHSAAHPAASLPAYVETLQQMVLAGYRRGGFPNATVAARLDTNARRIVLQVNEGPRYVCREIKVMGALALTNDLVREVLVEAVSDDTRPRPNTAAETVRPVRAVPSAYSRLPGISRTNASKVYWFAGEPAPFDDTALGEFTKRAIEALATLGRFQPKVHLTVTPDPSGTQADLLIDIVDAGQRGVIEEIEFPGQQKNTREQLLDYLDIKRGQSLDARLVQKIRERLWNSARFLKHEVTLIPLAQAGKLKLQITLVELKQAPPLNQDFSPEDQTLRKLRDWLTQSDNCLEDLVCSLALGSELGNLKMDIVFSPSGLAILVQNAPSNAPPALHYAVVASSRLLTLYSGVRQRKLAFERSRGQVILSMSLLPGQDAESPSKFSIGPVFSWNEALQPFRLVFTLAPVEFVGHRREHVAYSFNQGVLTVSPQLPSEPWEMKVDAASGRLISLDAIHNTTRVRIRSEEDAYARMVQEITSLTATYPNDFLKSNPLSSGLAFLAADLLRLPSLLPALFPEVPAPQLAQIASMVERLDLAKLLAPLDRPEWMPNSASDQRFPVLREDRFDLPRTPQGSDPSQGSDLSMTAVLGYLARNLVLPHSDVLWPRGSWLWTLTREATFLMSGRDQHTAAEIARLGRSDDMGPLGCLAAVKLSAMLNPEWQAQFARWGLLKISATGFQKDLLLLFRDNSVMGQVLGNALATLGSLNDKDVAALTALLKPEEAAFLRQCAQQLHTTRPQPLADALWPAIEQHWDKLIRPWLEDTFAQALNDAAVALADLKKPAEAEALFREALAIQKKLLGPEHLDIAQSLYRIGLTLSAREKFAEAEVVLRESLAMRQKLHGKDHEDVATSLCILGLAVFFQDKEVEAEALLHKTLAMWRRLPGSAPSDVALTMENYAMVLFRQGRFAEWESCLRESTFVGRDLAGQKWNRRELEKAIENLTRALQDTPEEDRRKRTHLLQSRAFVYGRQGQWQPAASDMSQVATSAPAFTLGPLLVETTDTPGYLNFRRRLWTKCAMSEDPPTAAETALALVIQPVDTLLSSASDLADLALSRGTNQARMPYFQLVKALAEYRQKQFANASDWARKSHAGSATNYTTAVSAGAVLAMALFQLKESDAARQTLTQAAELSQTKLPQLESGDLGENWPDWLIARILLREATTLIEGKPATPKPQN